MREKKDKKMIITYYEFDTISLTKIKKNQQRYDII